jgi:predicted choloylglycine hydrolase
LEGTAYEVGQQQGAIISSIPPVKQWFCSGGEAFSEQELADLRKQVETFCPGLLDEIQGCAGSLGIPAEQIVYLFETYLRVNHCSHFAVLPSVTANQHLLVGRSYDFNDAMDDLSFVTTRITGKYAHIGSPGLWLGRNDGINEHGLVVTMSTGGIPVGRREGMTPPIQTGFMFWALVRTLLEQCRTVDEAIALIERFPCTGNPILMLADQQGQAAVVEIWGPHRGVKRIDAASAEQFIGAANHFTIPAMMPHAPHKMRHSDVRYNAITARLQQAAPQIMPDTMRGILSELYPHGVCAHYYDEFFGTLHSIIFDATVVTAEVCFGSPHVNGWHTFDLRQPGTAGEYRATLPIEHPTPDFWERLPIA